MDGMLMTSRSGETRISDERLAELIAWWGGDTQRALRELAATRREGWVLVPLYPTQDAFDAGLSQLPKGTTSLNLQAYWNAMVKVMQRDYRATLAAIETQSGEGWAGIRTKYSVEHKP